MIANRRQWLMLMVVVLMLVPVVALAQPSTDIGPTTGFAILDNIRLQSAQMFGRLQTAAEGLLLMLATVSLAWKAMHLVLRNADMQEFVTEVFQLILVVGFYLIVIRNARPWTEALTQGFLWLGSTATGGSHTQNLSPVGILQQGVQITDKLMAASSWATRIQYIFVCIPIIVLYGLMAAYAAIVQCEVWLVVAAGMIFLGFGGSDWTAEYAKRYLTYCLSASAKLYILYLILGFGQQAFYNWVDGLALNSLAVVMGPIALLVLLTFMVIQVPNILQSLINGVAMHSGAPALVGMAAMAARPAAMAAVASGIGGGAMAVSEAAKMAGFQLGADAGGAATGSFMGVPVGGGGPSRGQVLGQTLSNLGSGVMGMAGGHIMQSTTGGRIAQNLHARRVAAEMDLGGGPGAFSGSIAPGPAASQPYVSPAHQRE